MERVVPEQNDDNNQTNLHSQCGGQRSGSSAATANIAEYMRPTGQQLSDSKLSDSKLSDSESSPTVKLKEIDSNLERKKLESVPQFHADIIRKDHDIRQSHLKSGEIAKQTNEELTSGVKSGNDESISPSFWTTIRRQVEATLTKTYSLSRKDTEHDRETEPTGADACDGGASPTSLTAIQSIMSDEIQSAPVQSPLMSPLVDHIRRCPLSPPAELLLSGVPTNEGIGMKHVKDTFPMQSRLVDLASVLTGGHFGAIKRSPAPSGNNAPYGFSFSPAGLLLPYHLGVLEYLVHAGMITEDTPLAGASAGAIAALVGGLQRDVRTLMPFMYQLEANLRSKGTGQRLAKEVRLVLNEVIKEKDHEILNSRTRPAQVIYTTVMPWRGQVVGTFSSKEDLIQCLLASCNIPFYFQRSPTVKCRGYHCVDGYFSDRKNFGCPKMANVDTQVRILPFSAVMVLPHLAPHEYISPDLSIFDNNIPQAEYDAFMEYVRDFPVPFPNQSPHPELRTEPAPVLAYRQPNDKAYDTENVVVVDPLEPDNPVPASEGAIRDQIDFMKNINSKPVLPIDNRLPSMEYYMEQNEKGTDQQQREQQQREQQQGDQQQREQQQREQQQREQQQQGDQQQGDQQQREHVRKRNGRCGRREREMGHVDVGNCNNEESALSQNGMADCHMMMITKQPRSQLTSPERKLNISRHSSLTRKEKSLFKNNLSRQIEGLNVQTPHHYPLVTNRADTSVLCEAPHEKESAAAIADDFLPDSNGLMENKGIIRRLLRRRSKERRPESSIEGTLIDRVNRSDSLGKSGDEAEAEGETEKTSTWSFWGLGRRGFMSVWVSGISGGRQEDVCEDNDDGQAPDRRRHPRRRRSFRRGLRVGEHQQQQNPAQITSYSLYQRPPRTGLLRRRGPAIRAKYPGLPIPRLGWRTLLHYALNPTNEDEEVRELYHLGRTDAFRWVQLIKKRANQRQANQMEQ